MIGKWKIDNQISVHLPAKGNKYVMLLSLALTPVHFQYNVLEQGIDRSKALTLETQYRTFAIFEIKMSG